MNTISRPLRIGDRVVARNHYNGDVIKGKIDDFDGYFDVYIRNDEYIHKLERRHWEITIDKETDNA